MTKNTEGISQLSVSHCGSWRWRRWVIIGPIKLYHCSPGSFGRHQVQLGGFAMWSEEAELNDFHSVSDLGIKSIALKETAVVCVFLLDDIIVSCLTSIPHCVHLLSNRPFIRHQPEVQSLKWKKNKQNKLGFTFCYRLSKSVLNGALHLKKRNDIEQECARRCDLGAERAHRVCVRA